jgi:hypothetical protein
MLNNVALDVFIGLVLVYLLYSLLVTIIGEILATWMGLRSRILRVSIEKMLNDGYERGKGIISFLQRYFLKEFPGFSESFAGRFYEYPAIKYLSNKAGEQTTFFSQTKPSYLTAEIFSDTLIQLIKDKGTGTTDMEKVAFSLKYNTHHIQLATLRHLSDMFDNSAGNIFLFKDKIKQWYNETQDRATGWYKRKLQLILFWLGFVIAIIFNVDSIRIAQILSKDREARDKMVEIGIQLYQDTARYRDYVMPNGNTVHSHQLLDTSFARIKKDIDDASHVLGLGWPKGTKFSLASFIGLFITALMLSIGAPFWFDLLKKLVSLRGAGVKPEEKKDNVANTRTTTGTGDVELIPRPQQPATEPPSALTGLSQSVKTLRAELTLVKGIQSIEEGFIKRNKIKEPAIEIHVEDNAARQAALARVGDVHNGYPINYYIVSSAKTHGFPNLDCGSEIGNISRANGFGTLGCFIRKKNSDRIYLLSCWHVLKSDPDWWGSLGRPEVIDVTGKEIARITDGTLANTFDVGIAMCRDTAPFKDLNDKLKITKDWREVKAADSTNEVAVHFCGKISGHRKAVIYNHKVEKSLKYPDNRNYLLTDLFSITVYDDQDNATSPSTEGDSGAVVVDKDGSPLGILIGGDDKFSYVVKFSNFLADTTPYRDYSIIV